MSKKSQQTISRLLIIYNNCNDAPCVNGTTFDNAERVGNDKQFFDGDVFMTHTPRHVNVIKERIAELCDKLSSLVNLMIMSSVGALFLFLFTTVHAKVHEYFDYSPWCPVKFAVTIMGLSFLLLNVVIVMTFVATEILRTLRRLRSLMNNEGGPIVPTDAVSVDQQQNVILTAVTNVSATITVSVTHALNNDDLLPQLPPSNDRDARDLHGLSASN